MPIYLGALPGAIFLASDNCAITFPVSTAILLQPALANLVDGAPSTIFQVANLWLFREDDQVAISSGSTIIFFSPAGARTLCADLPRYITIASTLACAHQVAAPARRSPLPRRSVRPAVRRPN